MEQCNNMGKESFSDVTVKQSEQSSNKVSFSYNAKYITFFYFGRNK